LGFWGGGGDEQAMDALRIDHLAEVPVRLLSSGQVKRATLARIAASGAPLWLLDEPLNALDVDGRKRLGALVERHLERGGTVLAASHQHLGVEWRKLELCQRASA
jgi:heme exporter protein A